MLAGAAAAPEASIRHAASSVPPLIAASQPHMLVAALDAGALPSAARIAAETRAAVQAVAETARSEGGAAAGVERALLIDVLAATRLRPATVASRTAGDAEEPASARTMLEAALPIAPDEPRLPAFAMSEPATLWRASIAAGETARPSLDASVVPAVASGSGIRPMTAMRDGAEGTPSVKLAAVEATKAAASVAKRAAEEARSVKLAAGQAKDTADQAKAAKDAADQAKAAKDAADQAKAAKDAADQAKAAKDAADQAKAAKDAADQAKAAKDAADQAKAAKDAADQAKAAKEAADQAKAAKDAAEQAKAAKDAADQAKAAKDAAAQAKAAKEAADAAKEAAKAAKDAAKAAKEAAKAGKGT